MPKSFFSGNSAAYGAIYQYYNFQLSVIAIPITSISALLCFALLEAFA